MKRALHITHTDIHFDSRICKEIYALEHIDGLRVYGLGLKLREGNIKSEIALSSVIETYDIFGSRWKRRLPRPVLYTLKAVTLTILFTVRGVAIKPDVVHCHDTIALIPGSIISMICGSSVVYDAHELESDKNGQSILLRWATYGIEKLLWGRIDWLITVSGMIEKWYLDRLGQVHSSVVLNSPLEYTDELRSEKGNIRDKFKIAKDRALFVYSGLLSPGRGIEIALEAFSEMEGSHLVFLGYGELKSEVERYSKRFNNIHIHEPVAHEEVVSVLKGCSAGLCLIEKAASLSDYYALPNKLFEYIFAGIGVIGTDLPEISRVVNKYGLGTTIKLDKESLKEATLNWRGRYSEIKDNSVRELSWESQAAKLREIYGRLLGTDMVE